VTMHQVVGSYQLHVQIAMSDQLSCVCMHT
jgi:hypothetical protein